MQQNRSSSSLPVAGRHTSDIFTPTAVVGDHPGGGERFVGEEEAAATGVVIEGIEIDERPQENGIPRPSAPLSTAVPGEVGRAKQGCVCCVS